MSQPPALAATEHQPTNSHPSSTCADPTPAAAVSTSSSTSSSGRLNYLPTGLASVEVALISHFLDRASRWHLLRACRQLYRTAAPDPFVWKHAQPLLDISEQLLTHDTLLASSLVAVGQIPCRLKWANDLVSGVSSFDEELARMSAYNLVELDCMPRDGLADADLAALVRHPSLSRSITKLFLGGYHNRISGGGLATACVGLKNLARLSLDHIQEGTAHDDGSLGRYAEDRDRAAAGDDASASVGPIDTPAAAGSLLAVLPQMPCLTSLQITRWMAEDLTPHSLQHIAACPRLRSLYLENLECLDAPDLRAFFSDDMFHRLEHLTLRYVQFKQLETFLAFFEEGASSTRPDTYYAPRKGMFDRMAALRTIEFNRCRDCWKMVPQLLLLPCVEQITFRGLLDSWGVELPRRDELLQLANDSASKVLRKVTLLVHASAETMENYRAQVEHVPKVEFKQGFCAPDEQPF